MFNKPKLTVIGAGPGDVELITLKAIRALRNAEVVLYDALVDIELLEYAPQAEQIFVGKRRGCYSYQQEQINELIVSRAKSHGHVVRLKGGDPFVFGRGAEEMEYAAQYGLEVALVPGISSCLSVPAAQNIPVTKRGSTESFWVITGTTKEHKISNDIRLAAKSSATVVILMGMSKLSQIVELFKKEGKSETPIAIIQNGTRADEKVGVATIASIEKEVLRQELANPAIIIIGEVVHHRTRLLEIQSAYEQTRNSSCVMERNNLYPVFLKASNLHILIVGGGHVAEEKLTFLTKSSPDAKVTMVSPMFRNDTKELAAKFDVELITDDYHAQHLMGKHMVIATTDVPEVNIQVYNDCRSFDKLVNVADNPSYCDFYMGGIVTKGNVKIAISTNGKSPTTAKRLRQFFEDVIPEDITKMVQNLNEYRKTIKGDFEQKVDKMNEITQKLVEKV